MQRLAADPRPVLGLALVASVGALAAAFAGQYLFGLEPCVLCLWQRLPYALAAAFAIAVLALGLGRGRGWPLGVCAGLFALGGAIAVYHVGVEQHWWGSIAGCAGTPVGDLRVEDLQPAALLAAPRPCDRVDFTLFGLSLAGWNVLASAGLAAACLAALSSQRRTPTA